MRNSLPFILSVVLFALCIDVRAQSVSSKLSEAQKLYDEQEFEGALAILEEMGESEAEALVLKGHCFQEEEKYVAALQAYEAAEKASPEWSLPKAFQGAALINLGHYKRAVRKVNEALKIDPDLPEGHYYLGNAAYFEFKPNAAIRHYNRALELNPEYRNAMYMRAAAYAELEKYGQALGDYEGVIALDPTLEVARFNAAVIRLQNHEYEKAAELLKDIDPQKLPTPADYHYYQGEALYFAKREEEACEFYLVAAKMGDAESKEIYDRYCVNKEEREEELKMRTIRMAF